MHIYFRSLLLYLSDIQDLVPHTSPELATSVTSVKLNIHPKACSRPDMDKQPFHHLVAWFPHLQRVHIHLQHGYLREMPAEVLISAAWFPAHCRLIVTHNMTCPVRVVKCPSGCLSLPLSSRPADDMP